MGWWILVNFIPRFWLDLFLKCCIEYASPWAEFELTTLVVIGIYCTDICKCNTHTIMSTTTPFITCCIWKILQITGADSGFQVRGGRTQKNCAERRESRKYLGYFVWKITILRQKIIFFSQFYWGVGGGFRMGPLDPPPNNICKIPNEVKKITRIITNC